VGFTWQTRVGLCGGWSGGVMESLGLVAGGVGELGKVLLW